MLSVSLRQIAQDHPIPQSGSSRIAEHMGCGFDAMLDRALADFVALHDPDCERGWVAEVRGRPIAWLLCSRLSASVARLQLYRIVSEQERRGLGPMMVEHALQYARSTGYRHITLWTHQSPQAAAAPFAHVGWTLLSTESLRMPDIDLVAQNWEMRL